MKIGIFVGSLRTGSHALGLAKGLVRLPSAKASYEIVQIGDLPFYNADLETSTPPQAWVTFRNSVASLDGLLFVTPEYNRSVPAVLKNAIDVGSRPMGKSVWANKAGAVVSISMGALGGFGANHHLRQSMVFLDVPMLQQPEAYIGNAGELLAADGSLKDGNQRDYLARFIERFESFVRSASKVD